MNEREFNQSNVFCDVLPLAERLRARIRLKGAITFRDFMQSALYDERGGYYQQSNIARWGARATIAPARKAVLFSPSLSQIISPRFTKNSARRRTGRSLKRAQAQATLRADYSKR
jgi:hypothetical protein